MGHPPSIYDAFAPALSVAVQSVLAAILIVLFIAWRVRSELGPNAVIPDGRFSLRNVIEVMFEGIAKLAHDSIGHDWRRYMPLVITLGIFILVGNLMGLVPGLGGPTSFVETNLSWALIAVTASEAAAIQKHGFLGWVKHMCPGPIWLAPVMFLIELFSHLVRYVTLTIRLTANMFADHTLAAIFIAFGGIISLFVPWIVLGLGVFVCFVQAFIFTFLTILYIGMGTEEAHH